MSEKIWEKLARSYIKAGAFPIPVNETMVTILKELLTEAQAELLLHFKKPSYNINELKEKVEMDVDKLQSMLKELAYIGALTAVRSRSTGVMVYRMPPFFPGLLEFTLMKGEVTEKSKRLARLWQVFFNDIVELFQGSYDNLIPLLDKQGFTLERIVPVNSEVGVGEEKAFSLEDLTSIIKNQETIGLATCYCRHRKDLLDDPCKRTDERKNCFIFGKGGEYCIENGFAEKISADKALEILSQCEDSGLVHKAFHSALDPTKDIDGLCNCCDCCCGTFSNHYAGGFPLMSLTSYLARVDRDKCVGCGTCIEVCNAKALELEETLAKVLENRCLGCGVCAHLCPEDAITLEKIDQHRVFVPPARIKQN